MAFAKCSGLKEVVIPQTVTTIGPMAFARCPALESIRVDGSNNSFTVQDGVLFNKKMTSLIFFPPSLSKYAYTIPDSVTTIEVGAFAESKNLQRVTLPITIKSIGEYAFYGCDFLWEVYYGGDSKNWTAISIGKENTPLNSANIHYNSQ